MTITNELIAIKVMEWEPISNSPDASFMWRTPLAKARHADYLIELPDFLHDMSAAWLVVEEMRRRGYELHLAEYADKKYCCEFIPKESGLPHTGIEMDSDTAQEAICKAALAVVIM